MIPSLAGMPVTVMGLGLHGGGLASVHYLVACGAEVTVTDLRSERELASGLEQLPTGVRSVLGTHEVQDFRDAELVVKNPAVPRTAPMLAEARAVTTDIALFLADWSSRETHEMAGAAATPGPLVAITGTKGKSSTSAATAHLLRATHAGARLGGNITVSPLTFVDALQPGDPVVLELSSFQLGDLAYCRAFNNATSQRGAHAALPERALYPTVPASVAVITNIFRDHQDYYGSMEAYVEDKREVYRHLASTGTVILPAADRWSAGFIEEAHRLYGAGRVVTADALPTDLLPASLSVPGDHSRRNLAVAAAATRSLGVQPESITAAAASFAGVPHRLEVVARTPHWTAVNDSAATIPEAAAAAVSSFEGPVLLIAGGSDKGLDPQPLIEGARLVVARGGAVFLLDGSATPAIRSALERSGVTTDPPFNSLEAAFDTARKRADELKRVETVILLSPGCASFGMFRNEFDRGDQFRRQAQSAIR